MSDSKERKSLKAKAAREFAPFFVGKTIKRVRYMTSEEVEACMWYNAAIVIEFTDGSWIAPMSDDEGNSAGALMTSDEKLDTVYTI